MTLNPELIQAALDHALVTADLEASAPTELGEPALIPAGARPRNSAGRRRPVLVAALVASVVCLGVGIAVLAEGPGSAPQNLLSSREPVGPVVAAGTDARGLTLVDAYDGPPDAGASTRSTPRAHLQIYESPAGHVVAVADRSTDGDGSLDRFPLEVASTVQGIEVLSTATSDLDVAHGLDVSGWTAGDRHIRVATRGLSATEHDAHVRALVAASLVGSVRQHTPDRFSLRYEGPDGNPFYGLVAASQADYRDSDGQRVSVVRYDAAVDAEQLARYAWYRTAGQQTSFGDVPGLMASNGSGTSSLYLARPDGFTVITGPTQDLPRYADAVTPLDASGWTALQASATAPGSVHQSVDATDPP